MPSPDRPKQRPAITFYPAFCYEVSPTWQKWVKLTCWDLHEALRPHHHHGQSYTSGPNANQTLFYINHPIQYVQLVGIVVAIEDYHEHLFLLTLDDSSSSTLDVVLRKPKPQQPPNQHAQANLARAESNDLAGSDDENENEDRKEKLALLETLSSLTIGSTVLVKGTITTFRGTRQLALLRLQVLRSTTAELQHTAARTAFLSRTLGKPWVVSDSRQQKLRAAAQADKVQLSVRATKARARRQEQAEWERRREQLLQDSYKDEERLRLEAAEEARRDGERVMLRRSKRSKHEKTAKAKRASP